MLKTMKQKRDNLTKIAMFKKSVYMELLDLRVDAILHKIMPCFSQSRVGRNIFLSNNTACGVQSPSANSHDSRLLWS